MPENVRAFQVVPPNQHIRFGPFEVDSRAGELRKHGIRIKLGQQTFQILFMLLKQPGEVVMREEIRNKLWPHDTVVEFDHSINAAIQKLRDALGESADKPRYIETLPRRGYRFIGTVEAAPAEPASEPALSDPATPELASEPAAPLRWSPLVRTLAVALLGVLAVAGWLGYRATRAPARNWTLSLGAVGQAIVSPDGSAVIYPTSRGVILRRLDSLAEIPVYANNNQIVDIPGWSPDSSQILFGTFAGLFRVPLPNGPPAIVWPHMPITRGYSWGPGGSIISSTLGKPEGGELYLVSAQGGNPTRLEVPGLSGGRFHYPEFLPDGNNILFAWQGSADDEGGLYLATLRNGKLIRGPLLLRKNMTAGHYTPSAGGRLLYVQNDKLYAQKLNIRRGTLEGEPERVVDGVYSVRGLCRASFSVSRNGILVWTAGRAALARLTWFDRSGRAIGAAGPPCDPDTVRLSPDQKHVVLKTADLVDYSIVEPGQSGHVALRGLTRAPLWMPDSAHILYTRKDGNSYRVLERAAEGGAEKELARLPTVNTLRDLSPDGKVLLYRAGPMLYSVRLDGSPEIAKPRMIAETVQGRFSPDGRWIVYSAITPGSREQVYVQPFASGGLRQQLTSTGGESPVWRGDGKEIVFRHGTTIYSIPVEAKGNTFHAGPPEALFKVRATAGIVLDSEPLAVTRDGSNILFAQGVEQPDPQLTYVMTAWDTALRQ
jgi:DNA-binding winged helix-turn-helix (wHTH) protein/Tol biopolymer transport system component